MKKKESFLFISFPNMLENSQADVQLVLAAAVRGTGSVPEGQASVWIGQGLYQTEC